MNYNYPEPKPIDLSNGRCTMHQRSRVVIMQPTYEHAEATSEELSESMACDLETFVAYVNNETGELVGEVVVGRKFYPCKGAMVPV